MPEIHIPKLNVRRFELPDLSKHGGWLLKRLLTHYPHLANEQVAAGFLRGLLYNNEYNFLYADHAVGLFQVISGTVLRPKPMLIEHFVWVENREDKAQVADAAQFYTHAHVWATHLNADVMIVEECSDVPHDAIKEKLGRLFVRQQQFARV